MRTPVFSLQYSGEEDYRWAVVRAFCAKHDPFHPLGREVFSLTFIAAYQTLLIWAFSGVPVWQTSHLPTPLNAWDALLTIGAAASILGETWTDNVQFAFQTAKHKMTPEQRAAASGDFARGFCTRGPFRFSRHLNFFCEQCFWVCIFGFTVAGGAPLLNVGGAGVAALIALFQGSTWMTELLTVAKYDEYRVYQRTTSRLLPWVPGPDLDSIDARRLARAVRASGNK